MKTLKYNPQSIEKIVLLESVSDNKIKEIRRICDKNNIKVEITGKKDFEKIFDKKNKSEGISQGIIAKVQDFKYAGIDVILERVKTKNEALLLILG